MQLEYDFSYRPGFQQVLTILTLRGGGGGRGGADHSQRFFSITLDRHKL